MTAIDFRLLGPLQVRRDGATLQLRPLQQRLAGLLLLELGAPVRRDAAIAQLWEFARPPDARGTLHVEVRNLRDRLEPGTPASECRVLLTTSRGYLIDPAACELDLAHLLRFHAEGRAALDAGDDGHALTVLAAADELWRGPLLAGESAGFVRRARERYEAVRLSVKEGRCLAMLRLGDRDGARRYLWAALTENPGSEPLRTLMEEVLTRSRRGAVSAPGESSPARRAHLPRYELPFIGREAAAEELARAVGRSRLVTLVGLVGMGKSRLALHAAESLAGGFRDGARYVDLPPSRELDAAAQAVLTALGGRELPGSGVVESLARFLEGRELLLLLDSCESSVPAAGELVRRLLDRCPRVHVLAASRLRLGVEGEEVFRLSSLAVPPPGETPAPEDLLASSEAVRLFVERARRSQPAFRLDAATAADVAAVCRRLDGIPLALEVAASQLHALSVRQLAERVDQRFLGLGRRTAGAVHHATLQAAFDAAHELLTGDESVLLRRLAAFGGPVSLECCEASCGYDPIAADRVTELLVGLVDKSLVVADVAAERPRYHLLRLVQLHAGRRLAEAGEADDVMARSLAWSLSLVAEARRHMNQPDARDWLLRIDAEYPAVRAALAWGQQHRALDALRLATALGNYWDLRGMMTEARRWLIDLLAAEQGTAAERARALHEAAWLTWRQGGYAEAEAMLVNITELLTADGLPFPAEVSAIRGLVAVSRGEHAVARAYLEPVVAGPSTDPRVRAAACYYLGLATWFGGGEVAAAKAWFEESLRLGPAAGHDPVVAAFSLGTLANLVVHEDRDLAVRHLRAAFEAFRDAGDRSNVIYALEGAARLHAVLGHDETAVQLASACRSLRQRIGASGVPAWDAYWQRDVALAERRLGDRAPATAEASRSLGLDALCAYAMETLDAWLTART